ncbi:MAG: putative collagen-binding domain-containing protein, partial [Bacteroidales bacterium]
VNRDDLVDEGFCFAKEDEIYAIYFPPSSRKSINLGETQGEYNLKWYNPRTGEGLLSGSVDKIQAGTNVMLGDPPGEPNRDWVCLISK